jgi:hypothetical protein
LMILWPNVASMRRSTISDQNQSRSALDETSRPS